MIGIRASPTGAAEVQVERDGPIDLALFAYEATHWTVHPRAGAVGRVIVYGPSASSDVTIDDGIPREVVATTACGFSYPPTTMCNTFALIGQAERDTGLPLTAFHGCESGSRFLLGELRDPPTWDPYAATGANLEEAALLARALGVATVRATTGHAAGRWYFEVELVELPQVDLEVGLASRFLEPGTSLALDPLGGCGYHAEGVVTCQGVPSVVAPRLQAGDRVGIAVDFEMQRVSFRHNGGWLEGHAPDLALAGLPLSGWGGRLELYPTVSLGGPGGAVRGHFGDDGLLDPPPNFAAGW